ncbi:hypothetical protein GOQ04_19470 [Emticicia sp. ODNR4P]|nr:hypothetical protein [Emticicia sp. ODNR4P]
MNLAHYLMSGIIVPSIYIENKNIDIQDKFKNYLLLSSQKFTKDTNCAIEIILNVDEEVPRKISDNFYLFDMPLPISRISNIYFTSEEQKVSTNFNITSGSAFIPDGLLKVSKDESVATQELDNVVFQPSEVNWSEYLKKYDQLLGGFSTMIIGKEKFQNYPTHYFSTLGNINNLFKSILEQQNIKAENSFQFAFTDEGRFKNFHNTIYSEVDYNEVQRYAENEKEKVILEVKNGLIQIDKIPENTNTYLVAILERYGKGKRMQVDSFISDLISDKFFRNITSSERSKKKEGLSLIFGLNKGYKAFRNKYKTANFEVDVKFHLDTKLDYYIIESIYQSVFNSLNSVLLFKYIDNLFSESKKEESQTAKYITYQMIDKTIILKERSDTSIERVLERISDVISKWFPFGVKKNEIESLFRADIESFKNSIEADLTNRYKAELDKNKTQIEQLNNNILEQEKTISLLEAQLKEVHQPVFENKKDLVEEKHIEANTLSNARVPLVNENSVSLFSDDIVFSSTKSREFDLNRMDDDKLQVIASQYDIKNIKKKKRKTLIADIIKHESKK